MDLETRLAEDLVTDHPLEAARAFERLPARDVAALLEGIEAERAARTLQQMASTAGAALLAELPPAKASELLARLPTESAVLLLRILEASVRDGLLAALPSARARELGSVLAFPEGTAGSLMDPQVLALPSDLTVREAVVRVRKAARNARYNVYVVDRDQVLVGVINLRELLMARPGTQLASLMKSSVHRLSARADRHTIVSHPGWREVHALPVVDEHGRYLGAVRYRTLRRLEEALRSDLSQDGATARALGSLFRAGASAMLEAVVATDPGPPETGRARHGA